MFSPRKARFAIAAVLLFSLVIFAFSKIGNASGDLGESDFFQAAQPKPPAAIQAAEKHAAAAPKAATGSAVSAVPKASSPKCSESEFVVMIDAGSTGSRVHVYEFNTCVSPPKLLREEFEMLKPGLSSFGTDALGAAKSLDPLLQLALKTVPAAKRGCTPVAVKATAGLRLLGEALSSKILAAVRTRLETTYPFAVVAGDGVSIMEGSDEGVYAWVTANYLLGNIGGTSKVPTAAVFDLGGGSTQIVFEPEFPTGEKMVDGEHKFEIAFGKDQYKLYQFSHLGFGLMQGRDKINSALLAENMESNAELSNSKLDQDADVKTAKAVATIGHPCIPPGETAKNVLVTMPNKDRFVVNFESSSTGLCTKLTEAILNKDAACVTQPCSFNGAHQPSLVLAFQATSDMYVFSYFYDRTSSFLPSHFTLQELKLLADTICSGEASKLSTFTADALKELADEPQWCMDLTFMVSLLHTGYDIPMERELKTAKKIGGNELGWCLGASLPLLDKTAGGWLCRVTSIE